MPQLDFSMYASQGLWMIGFFCLLWILLAVFVTPKITDIREKRKRKIHEYVRKAEQLSNRTKSTLQKYNSIIDGANEKARTEIERQQQDLQVYLEESEAKMSAKLNQQIASSEFALAKEKKETMQQIENISETLALSIMQRLGFNDISMHDIEAVAKKEKS